MEERIQNFRDLNVWNKSHDLVLKIYEITANFPEKDLHTLTDQLKRTATAIPASIAEGFQRKNKQDKTNLYGEAKSAANDILYLLILANDLNYSDTTDLQFQAQEIQKMLGGLIRSVLGINNNNNNNNNNRRSNDSFEPKINYNETNMEDDFL